MRLGGVPWPHGTRREAVVGRLVGLSCAHADIRRIDWTRAPEGAEPGVCCTHGCWAVELPTWGEYRVSIHLSDGTTHAGSIVAFEPVALEKWITSQANGKFRLTRGEALAALRAELNARPHALLLDGNLRHYRNRDP